jgi:hypothetical protein
MRQEEEAAAGESRSAWRLGTATPETYVATLYLALLGRPAEPSGLAYWAGLLHGGTTRQQVAAGVLGSEEYRARQVGDVYRSLLHRSPAPEEREHWLAQMRCGDPFARVKAEVLGSEEYFTAAGATPEQFLSTLYRGLLHRSLDEGSRSYWLEQLRAGMPRQNVAAIVLGSPEALMLQVRFSYKVVRDWEPDKPGAGYWVDRLREGTPVETLLATLLGSDDFLYRLQHSVLHSPFSDPNWTAGLFLHGPTEPPDLPTLLAPQTSFDAGAMAGDVSIRPTDGSAEPFFAEPATQRTGVSVVSRAARLRERVRYAYAAVSAGLPWSASRFASGAAVPDEDELAAAGFKLGCGW